MSDSPRMGSALAHAKMPLRSGRRAIDQHVPGAAQVPAEERKAAERVLGDDAQLERQRAEDHRDVVDALVIGDEHVGRARRQPLEALDLDAHAGRGQDQPRPPSRAPVREVPVPADQRRAERQRAEHDRVDARSPESARRPCGADGTTARASPEQQVERFADVAHAHERRARLVGAAPAVVVEVGGRQHDPREARAAALRAAAAAPAARRALPRRGRPRRTPPCSAECGRFRTLDASAAITARSAAGSSRLMPPAMFT